MQLYPQDLGLKRQTALIRARAAAVSGTGQNAAFFAPDTSSGSPLGMLGRAWTRGTGAEPRVAAAGLDAMRNFSYGMVGGMGGGACGFLGPAIALAAGGHFVPAIGVGAAGVAMASVGMMAPGFVFRRLLRKPVAPGEIEAMLSPTQDPLERAYLTLVLDALRQEVSPDAEGDLRGALRALGEAIDRLPASFAESDDTAALRQEATMAAAQARAEPDGVIQASLVRRAEALLRRADATDRSALLLRRAAALRTELLAQTEALRAGLTAFYTGASDIADLAQLAESVRGVAAEAASVADARAELDAAAPPLTLAGTDSAESVPLRLHRR